MKVLKLCPVAWQWRGRRNRDSLWFYCSGGEKILPEIVSDKKMKDGVYKHVATGDILPYLVGAINEQQQIDALRDELKRRGA